MILDLIYMYLRHICNQIVSPEVHFPCLKYLFENDINKQNNQERKSRSFFLKEGGDIAVFMIVLYHIIIYRDIYSPMTSLLERKNLIYLL